MPLSMEPDGGKHAFRNRWKHLETYIAKLKEYNKKLYVCGDRNSYSKTDPDATFMRMKEDAMLNGQLKPAYNLQHGVDSEYITWLDISSTAYGYKDIDPLPERYGAASSV